MSTSTGTWRKLSLKLREIDEILYSTDARAQADSSLAGPRVAAYGEEVVYGFSSLTEAVQRMRQAEGLLRDIGPGGALDQGQADQLLLIDTQVNEAIWEYHRVMSRYGCSICGELFRAIR